MIFVKAQGDLDQNHHLIDSVELKNSFWPHFSRYFELHPQLIKFFP